MFLNQGKFAYGTVNYVDNYQMDIVTTRNIGQAFTWSVMGSEAIQAIQDLRWMLVLCVILIIADYRFGREESSKRYQEAIEAKDSMLAKMYEFHFSRAIRRTCNKFVDYMTLLLIFCVFGFAVTEPYGICDHVFTAGIAVIIAWICEIASIIGHFLYLKGITVKKPDITWRSFFTFIGKLLASFAKKKDEDLGTALDETITQTLQDTKQSKPKKK